MFIISTEHSFDSAHFLAGYEGKCSHIHGHRWRVIIEVQAEKLKAAGQLEGMVDDFSNLKDDVKELVDRFDHCLIIQDGTMREKTLNCLLEDGFDIKTVTFRPTAENFSEYFYGCMEEKGYHLKRVSVYETPNNCAIYEKN